MKGLKKLALVSAMAAASFGANAELKALDDSMMSEMTGQAGLTIELETQVDIGSVVYTDEGSFAMNNIHVGGQGGTLLDDLQIDIDVEADGDAVIDVHSVSGAPIDFGITVGSVELNGTAGENTVLASNINMDGILTALNMRVDTATDTLIATVGFRVTDMNLDVDFMAVGVKNLTISSDNSAGTVTDATQQAIIAATGSAFATVTVGKAANANAASGEALAIGLASFEADINIGALEIGGTSIGSLAINDLVISNTTMEIYGH